MKKMIAFINQVHLLMNKKTGLLVASLMLFNCMNAQQKVIPLYKGAAPGSENWNWEEKEFFVKMPLNANVLYNVSKPTLTVFTPDTANGTAIIICPGGGFRVLNFENEGYNVAKELTKKGITVFLLKYRVAQSTTDDPWQEVMNSLKDTTAKSREQKATISKLAKQDAQAAILYVREHATAFNIDPKRIGMIGFSAGGALTIHSCINEANNARPDFAGMIYSVYKPNEKNSIPTNAPPAFIACATDDVLASPVNSINLYNAWIESKRPAELHIFTKGGHGLRTGNAKTWIHRFEEWLDEQGFLKPKK